MNNNNPNNNNNLSIISKHTKIVKLCFYLILSSMPTILRKTQVIPDYSTFKNEQFSKTFVYPLYLAKPSKSAY